MQTFRKRSAPRDPKDLPAHVEQLEQRIEESARRGNDYLPLRYLAVAPSKPQDGIYLSVAGVLGVSRGAYRYDADSGTYTFLA